MTRREIIQQLGLTGIAAALSRMPAIENEIMKRVIPSTQELLPCVGLGTWQTFDVNDSESERGPLKKVLQTLVEKGGSVIDSSPMYGSSEDVAGDLSTELRLNEKLFIATKVWTSGKDSGIRQMNESFRLLRRKTIDLMQVHNLTDWETHLKTMRDWKEQGRIRYIGLTHYLDSVHDRLAAIIAKEPVDFIQVNYNMLDRHAENRLLPAAQEKGVAVLINRPFEEGALFQRVKGKTLPAWAAEFDCASWGQFFLKYILSHPAVTCAIPGTSKPHHMLDNIGAAFGKLPDAGQRARMIKVLES